MNTEIITLESDDEVQYSSDNDNPGTATASILNEKPLNINLLLDSSHSVVPSINNLNKSVKSILSLPLQNKCITALNEKISNNTNSFVNRNLSKKILNEQNIKLGSSSKTIKCLEDLSIPTTSSTFNLSNNIITKNLPILKNLQKCNDELQSKIRRNSVFYIEASHGVLQNLNDDEFSGQFLCTYNNCSKRLRNNVNFMYHLWAHVNRFKHYVEEPSSNLQILNESFKPNDTTKNDLNRLLTCPECLLLQPTAYRMHLHYHQVHKPNNILQAFDFVVCKTCESLHDVHSVAKHLAQHGDSDMPYHCRKCRYRVSSREAMLNHFLESHCGTSLLLCPFCMYTYTVPQADRQRNIIVVKAYVQHMMDHDLELQYGCFQCVMRFSITSGANPESKIETHLKQHKYVNDRWKVIKKNFSSLPKIQSKIVPLSSYPLFCSECSQVLSSARQQRRHIRDLRKCDYCNYETNCVHSMELHSILSLCKSENIVRWPVGFPFFKYYWNSQKKEKKFNNKMLLQCSGCGLTGINGDAMCRHILKMKINSTQKENSSLNSNSEVNHKCTNAIIYTSEILNDDTNENKTLKAQLVKIFGLNRMKDMNPLDAFNDAFVLNNKFDVKTSNKNEEINNDENIRIKLKGHCSNNTEDEITMKLLEIFSMPKITQAKENQLMVKYLLEPCQVSYTNAIYLLNIVKNVKKFEKSKYNSIYNLFNNSE